MKPGRDEDRRSGRDVGIDVGDPALPVAGQGRLAAIRASRNSRRRAFVLLAVHVVIAAHITHWLIAERSVSPVEPSEAMYTLELGQVNAGFVFLIVAMLATLIFGRFFCGWGCHLVALQDTCGWVMKKLGVRPRPFFSRLMLLGPAVLAAYMFFWPTVRRVAVGLLVDVGWIASSGEQPFPGFSNELLTSDFWATFPGPVIAVLTFLTCGFAAVYVLGAKGFCSYGCPYGALFVWMDRLSPARIVVNDDCEQCGHCSATCTSNVLVHEEVRRFGMVVDPGCMKCLDCVSVCPKNALRYGFARPAIVRGRPADDRAARRFRLSWPEELFCAFVFVSATLAFRGLYDGPSLLMAIGLGGITAFAALKLWQMLRRPTVRLQNLSLKIGGRMTTPGWIAAALVAAWLVFTAHSAFVQWHRSWGQYHLNLTEVSREDALSGAHAQQPLSARSDRSARRTARHFTFADRWGLVPMTQLKLGRAWGYLLTDRPAEAETMLREAIALQPDSAELHDHLVDFYLGRGRFGEAAEALETKLAAATATAKDRFELASLFVELGEPDRAVEQFRAIVRLTPESAEAHFNLGGMLRRKGDADAAAEALGQAARLAPNDYDTHVELGLACMAAERWDAARVAFERAIAITPDSPESTMHLPKLLEQIEQARADLLDDESR